MLIIYYLLSLLPQPTPHSCFHSVLHESGRGPPKPPISGQRAFGFLFGSSPAVPAAPPKLPPATVPRPTAFSPSSPAPVGKAATTSSLVAPKAPPASKPPPKILQAAPAAPLGLLTSSSEEDFSRYPRVKSRAAGPPPPLIGDANRPSYLQSASSSSVSFNGNIKKDDNDDDSSRSSSSRNSSIKSAVISVQSPALNPNLSPALKPNLSPALKPNLSPALKPKPSLKTSTVAAAVHKSPQKHTENKTIETMQLTRSNTKQEGPAMLERSNSTEEFHLDQNTLDEFDELRNFILKSSELMRSQIGPEFKGAFKPVERLSSRYSTSSAISPGLPPSSLPRTSNIKRMMTLDYDYRLQQHQYGPVEAIDSSGADFSSAYSQQQHQTQQQLHFSSAPTNLKRNKSMLDLVISTLRLDVPPSMLHPNSSDPYERYLYKISRLEGGRYYKNHLSSSTEGRDNHHINYPLQDNSQPPINSNYYYHTIDPGISTPRYGYANPDYGYNNVDFYTKHPGAGGAFNNRDEERRRSSLFSFLKAGIPNDHHPVEGRLSVPRSTIGSPTVNPVGSLVPPVSVNINKESDDKNNDKDDDDSDSVEIPQSLQFRRISAKSIDGMVTTDLNWVEFFQEAINMNKDPDRLIDV